MPDELQQQHPSHINNWYFTRAELEATDADVYHLHYKMATFIQTMGKQINMYESYSC